MENSPIYIQVSQQSRTVVIMSSKYPSLHLTISWMNKSGEIDIHMTRVLPDNSKLYSSIVKITEADIGRFSMWSDLSFEPQCISLFRSFFANAKPIRPGWLRRRGYLVYWVPEEEQERLMKDKLVKRHKKRGFRLYSHDLLNLNERALVEEHLYDPSILHALVRSDGRDWIQALPMIGRRKNRRKIISLKFINRRGLRGWFSIDSVVPAFGNIFEPIRQQITHSSPRILNTVFDDLRLSELGINRDEFISMFSS